MQIEWERKDRFGIDLLNVAGKPQCKRNKSHLGLEKKKISGPWIFVVTRSTATARIRAHKHSHNSTHLASNIPSLSPALLSQHFCPSLPSASVQLRFAICGDAVN